WGGGSTMSRLRMRLPQRSTPSRLSGLDRGGGQQSRYPHYAPCPACRFPDGIAGAVLSQGLPPRSTGPAEGMASGWSARPEPGLAVEEFPGDVQVTGMSRGLLDHVKHDPAHIRRFLLP